MKRFLLMALALTMLVAGCSTEVTEYRQQQPRLDIFTYFQGKTEAWGMVQDRRHIRRVGQNRYEGTAGDIEGVATGQAAGNALNWRYSMNVKADGKTWLLHFDDWMYLQDSTRLFNKTEMKKFGVTVATVTLFFTRKEGG